MPRLRDAVTGVTVSVSDETAALLGAGWVSADSEPAEKPAAEKSEKPDSTWKVEELKAFATEHTIDLGDAKKKDELIAAIAAASV